MPKAGGIPEKTSDFNTYLQITIPLLLQNNAMMNVLGEEITSLKNEWGEENAEGAYPEGSWKDLYARKMNPLTSTPRV